eukprot:4694716-Prymnesium_polylepis.1
MVAGAAAGTAAPQRGPAPAVTTQLTTHVRGAWTVITTLTGRPIPAVRSQDAGPTSTRHEHDERRVTTTRNARHTATPGNVKRRHQGTVNCKTTKPFDILLNGVKFTV